MKWKIEKAAHNRCDGIRKLNVIWSQSYKQKLQLQLAMQLSVPWALYSFT